MEVPECFKQPQRKGRKNASMFSYNKIVLNSQHLPSRNYLKLYNWTIIKYNSPQLLKLPIQSLKKC
jgi:hypothetical protein